MLASFILAFSMLGVALWQDDYQNLTNTSSATFNGAFDHVPIASLRMFVLFTTENYPMITLPAWKDTPSSFTFYFIFVYAGVFFLTSILLALIVSLYLEYAGAQVHDERKKEWKGLMKAFQFLDNENRGYLCFAQFRELMAALRPKAEIAALRFYFQLLDRDGNQQARLIMPRVSAQQQSLTLLLWAAKSHAVAMGRWIRLTSLICARSFSCAQPSSTTTPVHIGQPSIRPYCESWLAGQLDLTIIVERIAQALDRYTGWRHRASAINVAILFNTILGAMSWKGMSPKMEQGLHATSLLLAICFVFDNLLEVLTVVLLNS